MCEEIHKTTQIDITPKDSNFEHLIRQSSESRRLKNALNSALRHSYFYDYKKEYFDMKYIRENGLRAEFNTYKKSKVKKKLPKTSSYRNNGFGLQHTRFSILKYAKIVSKTIGVNLPAKSIQETALSIYGSWSSYFKSRRSNNVTHKVNIPGYSKSYYPVYYRKDMYHKWPLRDGYISVMGLPEPINIKHIFTDNSKIEVTTTVVEVIHSERIRVSVSYKERPSKDVNLNNGLIAGLDPGLKRLMTIGFSDFREGIIIDGKEINRINKVCNRYIDRLKSRIGKDIYHLEEKEKREGVNLREEIERRRNSKRLKEAYDYRNRRLKQYYETVTNVVSEELHKAGVETLVIGWNKGIKQGISLGKKNNRHFVEIPHKRILDNLAYKCETRYGIEVVYVDESYTSKASFIDNDPLPVKYTEGLKVIYSGRRYKGQYITREGREINADLNGALNIIRKYHSSFRVKNGIGGFTVAPLVKKPNYQRGEVVPPCRRLTIQVN